jgi:hypothetical protein
MTPISPEDIRRMKECGYDPLTIREAEAQLVLFQRGLAIAEKIRTAFHGVKLGDGVGLNESLGLDEYADKETLAEYRLRDETEDWQKIPSEALNCGMGGLSFFDAEGMRFHLPIYMIADIKGEYDRDMSFNLTHLSDHGRSQFRLLSDEQRQCVREFLIYLLDNPDYRYSRKDIERALDSYWTE